MKFFGNVRKATTGSTTGPLEQGTRSDLDNSLRSGTITQPFTGALFQTNRRLGIHGDHELDAESSTRYQHLAKRVESGEVSNSYAFGSSAVHWALKGNATGAIMNTFGWLAAGAYDANERKLGRR